ncbi:hypothetical protein [Streptomyces sp. NPDC003247]|uniref:hypothetical protein n=1 Tax=Streptomyces sp. NPDC003247 TaxID=3364677 RepID=UPI00369A5800
MTTSPAHLHPAAARLPLVCRSHLNYPSFDARIDEVSACAAKSTRSSLPVTDRINAACAAWNLCALIASDCGLHDYAQDLCLRQLHLFRQAWPVTGNAAIAALQPLVNLVRLTARAGQKAAAYDQLTALHHAVHRGGPVTVHGHVIDLTGFTDDTTREHIRPWLQLVMLDDGTRLLTATAQWARAAAHATAYDDAHSRLGEAHQTRVIAALADGNPAQATQLISSSASAEPWETAVSDVLRHLVRDASGNTAPIHYPALATTVENLFHEASAHTRMFRTRLALTVIELAPPNSTVHAGLRETVAREVLAASDAHVAREILRRSPAGNPHRKELEDAVRSAGLGAGRLPGTAGSVMERAARIAGHSLTQCLTAGKEA